MSSRRLKKYFILAAVIAACLLAPYGNGEVEEHPKHDPDKKLFQEDKHVKPLELPEDLITTLSLIASPAKPDGRAEKQPHERLDAIMIMMYADWCPHCHTYSSVFSTLAEELSCAKRLKFFAFECSKTSHRTLGQPLNPPAICQLMGVTAYPTLYVFTRKPETGAAVESAAKDVDKKLKQVDQKILDGLLKSQAVVFPKNINMEKLEKSTNIDELKAIFNSRYPGTLDGCTEDLENNEKSQSGEKTRNESGRFTKDELSRLTLAKNDRWNAKELTFTPAEHLHDIVLSIGYILRNWVVLPGAEWNHKKRETAIELISVSRRLFPGKKVKEGWMNLESNLMAGISVREYHNLLSGLHPYGLAIPRVGVEPRFITIRGLTNGLWKLFHFWSVALVAQETPVDNDSISVLQMEAHRKAKSMKADLEESLPVALPTVSEVFKAVSDTASHLLKCDSCSEHFVASIQRGAGDLDQWVKSPNGFQEFVAAHTKQGKNEQVKQSEGLAAWLWRFHNIVTFRTAVEMTAETVVEMVEDKHKLEENKDKLNEPEEQSGDYLSFVNHDIRFPSFEICKNCRLAAKKGEGQNRTTGPLHTENAAVNSLLDWMASQRKPPQPAGKMVPAFVTKEMVAEMALKRLSEIRSAGTNEKQQAKQDSDEELFLLYDKISDFDVLETMDILRKMLWNEEWQKLEPEKSLVWSIPKKTMVVTQL